MCSFAKHFVVVDRLLLVKVDAVALELAKLVELSVVRRFREAVSGIVSKIVLEVSGEVELSCFVGVSRLRIAG